MNGWIYTIRDMQNILDETLKVITIMMTDPGDPVWAEIDNRRAYDKPSYEDIVIMPYFEYCGFFIMREPQNKIIDDGQKLIYDLLKNDPKAIFKKSVYNKVKEACTSPPYLEYSGNMFYSVNKNLGRDWSNPCAGEYSTTIKKFKTYEEAAKFLVNIVKWPKFGFDNNYKQVTNYYTYTDLDKNPCRYIYKHKIE